jgi:FixJ family two-component response regulator
MKAPAIYLVDDDPSVVKAVSRLLRVCGYDVRPYMSPNDFLEQHDASLHGCAVIDIAMPGLTGLAVQEALADSGGERQIVFITGEGDVPTSVNAMRAGAVDFLTKPFDEKHLLQAIETALARDRTAREARAAAAAIESRLATLTLRERQVLALVVEGRLNKQIAGDLGIAEKTVKVHRGRMMEKMNVRSVAELVRTTSQLLAGGSAAT